MREEGEDGFPRIFPQRVGNTDVGVAQERSMHASAGGYKGIRTVEYENNDGTITTLRTRLGWPVFETTEVIGRVRGRDVFQGFMASKNAPYGYKAGPAGYVPCLSAEVGLWQTGDKNVSPLRIKDSFFRGTSNWYDSRAVPSVQEVVTWRGTSSVGRQSGTVFIEFTPAWYYGPVGPSFPYNYIDYVDDDLFAYGRNSSTEVFVDGEPVANPIPDFAGNFVLCAAKHSNGKVRVLLGSLSNTLLTENTPGGIPGGDPGPRAAEKRYIVCDWIKLIEEGDAAPQYSAGWVLIGEIDLQPVLSGVYPQRDAGTGLPIEGNGFVAFLQSPLFNSSATKAAGLMVEVYSQPTYSGIGNMTPADSYAKDWLFEIDFDAVTMTKLEPGTFVEYALALDPITFEQTGNSSKNFGIVAVDYVGDDLKTLRYTHQVRSEITGALDVVESIYTDSIRYAWGQSTPPGPGSPTTILGTELYLDNYDLRNGFGCVGPTSYSGSFSALQNNGGPPDLAHVGAVVSTNHWFQYAQLLTFFPIRWASNVRYVTVYPGEQIAVFAYAAPSSTSVTGKTSLVVGNVTTDLLPQIPGNDVMKSLFAPIFYRKA